MYYRRLKWESSVWDRGGGNKTATPVDCITADIAEMGYHFLSNSAVEPAGRCPLSADFMKRSNRNQNLVWPIAFGAKHYPGRGAALDFLVLRNEESPEFVALPYLAAI